MNFNALTQAINGAPALDDIRAALQKDFLPEEQYHKAVETRLANFAPNEWPNMTVQDMVYAMLIADLVKRETPQTAALTTYLAHALAQLARSDIRYKAVDDLFTHTTNSVRNKG